MEAPDDDLLRAHQLAYEILVRKEHPQQDLLDPGGFRLFASKRLRLGLSALEAYERDGLLYPVLLCPIPELQYPVPERDDEGRVRPYEPTPIEGQPKPGQDTIASYPGFFTSLAEQLSCIRQWGQPWWPAARPFSPWDSERDAEGASTVWRYYHPCQLIRLHSVVRAYSVARGAGPELWDTLSQRLAEAHARSFRELALLLAVEDLYLPSVRGGGGAGGPQGWWEWQRAVDRERAVHDVGFAADDVREVRRKWALEAKRVDPCSELYMLMRHLPYWKRERLKGDGLLAWTYYEAVEVLGLLLEGITGARQPHADDLWGDGVFKERLYGMRAEEVDYYRRNALPAVLRRYGLDISPRVLWIVEGETEEAFVRTYCERRGWDLRSLLVNLFTAQGASPGKRRTSTREALLTKVITDARDSGAVVLISVDREGDWGDWERLLRGTLGIDSPVRDPHQLEKERVLPGVYPWRSSFEDSNFTTEDLFEALLAVAVQPPDARGAGLDEGGLRARLKEFRLKHEGLSGMGAVHAFADSVPLKYGKPALGKALAELVIGRRDHDAPPPEAPIEQLLQHVLLAAASLRHGRVAYPYAP